MRWFIPLLLVFAIGCPACFAGNGPDQKHVEKIKNQVEKYLERGHRVSVETYDQHEMSGVINEAGPDAFVLTVTRFPASIPYITVNPTTIPYTNVKKITDLIRRKRIIDGLIVVGVTVFLIALAAQDR